MYCVDELPKAIDGHRLRDTDREWTVEVYSASEHDGRCWIQVGVADDSTADALLNLPFEIEPARALRAYRDWLTDPKRQPGQVITVD
jgi:hypothetical protein